MNTLSFIRSIHDYKERQFFDDVSGCGAVGGAGTIHFPPNIVGGHVPKSMLQTLKIKMSFFPHIDSVSSRP